jgi:hypothetical protein
MLRDLRSDCGSFYRFQRFPWSYSWLNRANYVLIAAN